MIKVKNPNQLDIFDLWDFLAPKRRQMLDAGYYLERMRAALNKYTRQDKPPD